MFKTCLFLLRTRFSLLINNALQTAKFNQHIVNNSYLSNIYFIGEDYIMKTSDM